MTFMPRFFVLTALVCAPLFAHAQDAKPSGTPPAAVQDKTLTVFAAASMKNALDEANAAYTVKTGIKVVSSYAASSALAKQLEQGAPGIGGNRRRREPDAPHRHTRPVQVLKKWCRVARHRIAGY